MPYAPSQTAAYAVTVSGVAPPAPYAWWPINEGTGAPMVLDNIGTINGTIEGATWFNDPTRGWVLDFDGVNDRIEFGTPFGIIQNHGDLTAAAWVNADVLDQAVLIVGAVLAETTETEAGNAQYLILIQEGGGLYYLHEYGDGVNVGTTGTTDPIITLGWHHICVVRDTATKQYHFYVDGSFKQSLSYAGYPDPTGGSIAELLMGGMLDDAATPLYSFDGKISDTRYYTSALTASQVMDLYNATK